MRNRGQFDTWYPEGTCAVWEAICPDAADGTLSEAEQRAFERHIAGCVRCADEYANAQRGAAWLGMLSMLVIVVETGIGKRLGKEKVGRRM